MMRALFTAASGMIAQQTNVDVISNNLANVNSTGYKASTAEFKSLLYQTLQSRSTSANGDFKPVPAQVGTGTRNASITTQFSQGSVIDSSNPYAFAIEGNGLFGVMNSEGETIYTRNGNFGMAKTSEGGFMLCTSEGYPLLDTNEMPIEFGEGFDLSSLIIASDGSLYRREIEEVVGENGEINKVENTIPMDVKIAIFQFNNPSGLESIGNTFYKETNASGIPLEETAYPNLHKSVLCAGRVEMSNVQVADEMVNLIVAQRAYEMNSKAIQAADEMLSQANQLRRG